MGKKARQCLKKLKDSKEDTRHNRGFSKEKRGGGQRIRSQEKLKNLIFLNYIILSKTRSTYNCTKQVQNYWLLLFLMFPYNGSSHI